MSPEEESSPRLMETKGITGRSIALSHCRGSSQSLPALMTGRSNFHDHLASITWHSPPISYQDAITATRRLGLSSLRINSLVSFKSIMQTGSTNQNVWELRMKMLILRSPPPTRQTPVKLGLPVALSIHSLSNYLTYLKPVNARGLYSRPQYLLIASRSRQSWASRVRRMVPTGVASFRTHGVHTAESLVWFCRVLCQRETGGSLYSTARNRR
ncbi:hypothetical protein BDV96DRAFT_606380 [Lophiotrema nucula]|uniref:Uncharacterized protein n=1 Tax=Lophiotrema nucula TaxID=690887 RepID=A0A6A5YKQ8_9PLEO|nr:hypothetical protein BDV96DRAFT_606380 [Lophiotrema nucula]